jgi:hypothetical protein
LWIFLGCSVAWTALAESSVDVAGGRCGRLALATMTGRPVLRADGPDVVVELDRERVFCDVDGDDAAGVDAPERDVLAADGDHAGGADAALDGDGLGRGPPRRAGGPRALQVQRMLGRQRVRPRAQQFARLRVQEHQRAGLDPDQDRATAEDLGREHLFAGQGDDAALVDRAVDLDRGPVVLERQRRRPAATAPSCASARRSAVLTCERRLLIRAPAIVRWSTSTPAQMRTV